MPPRSGVDPSGSPVAALDERIPVVLLTGFLGTGKTTLLRRLLAEPGFERTAVLINEVGEVGLDHQIVFGAGGAPTGDAGAAARTAILLANGCVCCTVRDDLAVALDDLLVRSMRGEIPLFERVIIETTGLADPVPVIEAISSGALTAQHYRLARVIVTVDAAVDPARLDRHRESMAQVVCADDLLITRTDLAAETSIEMLSKRLRQINAGADILRLDRDHAVLVSHCVASGGGRSGAADGSAAHDERDARRADDLQGSHDPEVRPSSLLGPIRRRASSRPGSSHAGVQVSTLRFAGPSVWSEALKVLEQSLASLPGEVLRVKGVLRLVGHVDPMVVQWAGGHVSPVEPLPGALAEGDAGYLVIIATAASATAGTAG